MIKKIILLSLFIVVSVVGYCSFIPKKVAFRMEDFDLEEIRRGDILKTITANGTINPVNVVTVGTQVSGIVEKIYVDYNTPVKKNQRLAKLDTSVLQKSLNEAKEAVDKAEFILKEKQDNYESNLNLFKQNFISKLELIGYETAFRSSESDRNIARSKLAVATINLGYANIDSPVAGVVISREIDVGQTVAATFSAPILFKIAEDLTKMQIETSVSEADIGMIKTGLEISFTVDAYPSDVFKGSVTQIRLNPVNESNVVVYNVIITIQNEDRRLMPGMTAYVTIPVNEIKNVLTVSSVALRFAPDDNILKIFGLGKQDRQAGTVIVYKLERDGKVIPIRVKRGLSNLSQTELITDELRDGDKIISNSVLSTLKKK
jgi:HlyD family secretion protein